MVKSGLKENIGETKETNIKVSQYRLAVHYTVAIFLYSTFLSSGLYFLTRPQVLKTGLHFLNSNSIVRRKLIISFHLFLVTLISGNFMAGNSAGKVCNTFPKMGSM